MVLGFFRALCFLFLLLGCSNPYERDNPQDTIHTYTVTFSAGEAAGGVPPADITGHYGDVIQLPNQGGLMRYGFGLRKWKADSLGKLIRYEAGGRYTVTGNIAMSAVWVPIYTVAFDGNGATGGLPPAAVSADSGTATVLPANGTLEKTGYSFGGWSAASPYMVTGNATLYAKWIPVYAVAFDGNGATGGLPPAAVSADSGTVIELPANGALERAGYSFAGWDAASPYTVTGNATLYAKWVPVYAVAFDGNGATGGLPPAAMSADSGTVIELPANGTLERAWYFFAGWNTDSSGTGAGYAAGSSYAVAGNATLYAVWSSTPTLACAMTATTGTVGTAISPAPTVTCNGTAVTAGLAWTPANLTPTSTGSLAVSVSASSGVCAGMTANCGSVSVSVPTLACAMTATTGTVGTAISPAPTVTCNGTAVSSGLAWTPANLTPTSMGSLAVSVSASSGVCSGMTVSCGSVNVSVLTLACTMTATTGTVGVSISPTPTVTCNGTAVSSGLAWTPANLTPTSTGSLVVSVSASSGVCSGMTDVCGTVYVPPVVSNCEGMVGTTVTIGTQTWMKSNLNCNVEGSKCHSNELSNCDKYGRLYDWATAMNLPSSCNSSTCYSQIGSPHRGICPSGWHIPNDADWNVLMDYVGGSSTAGTKLKATSGWNFYSGIPVGTDQYGFSALPGGPGYSDGSFGTVGYNGGWWSASEYSSNSAYLRRMDYYREDAYWYDLDKSYLFSVRCLQD